MRIGYLTGQYPRATDTFIQREVAALRELGLDIHTFSIRRSGPEHIVGPEQQAEANRTFYLLPPALWPLLLAHLQLLLSQPLHYAKALLLAWSTRQHGLKGTLYQLFYFLEAGLLAHEIQRRQIQHLHNHFGDSSCTVAMLAAALGGFSFSFTLHGPAIFFEPYRWRLDIKLKRALFVSCISYFCRSQALLHLSVDQWTKLPIVHCGVDPSLFAMVQHDRPGTRLLYTGRLAAAKGLPILLDSLAQLKSHNPDIELLIVGDGGDRPQIEAQVQRLGLGPHVKFLGYQSQAQVRDWMQMADVFVLPSFAEGVPVSLMEAMAAGVPVVTTRIAGVSELVDDGISGYLVPPSDIPSLTAAIDTLLKNPQQRQAMGRAGRQTIERAFNIQHEAQWLHQIFTRSLQGERTTLRPKTPEATKTLALTP